MSPRPQNESERICEECSRGNASWRATLCQTAATNTSSMAAAVKAFRLRKRRRYHVRRLHTRRLTTGSLKTTPTVGLGSQWESQGGTSHPPPGLRPCQIQVLTCLTAESSNKPQPKSVGKTWGAVPTLVAFQQATPAGYTKTLYLCKELQ